MGHHGLDQLRLAQGRVGQVQRAVFVFAAAQQLPGTDPQFAEQVAQLGRVGRGFQVAHDGRREAALFEQLQGATGFRAAGIVIERQIGHMRVASCVRWQLF
ncbi:hypothetical protein D3C80_1914760 [compost metagenome]